MLFDKNIFLYKIFDGVRTYAYTNADQSISYDNVVYIAVPIKHSEIASDTQEIAKETVKITVSNETELVKDLFQVYDSFITTITIYRLFLNSDKPVEIEWKGELTKINFAIKDTSLTFGNVIYETQRQGTRQVYQRYCPYALYGNQCKADKEEHRTVYSVNDFEIINDYQIRYLNGSLDPKKIGGIVRVKDYDIDTDSYFFIRQISSDLTIITVNRIIHNLGTEISLYDGCNRSMSDCHLLFNNSSNFGGFVLLPMDNPTTINYTSGSGADKNTVKLDDDNIIGGQ